jgi:AcrR family transcriptional regulator
MDAKERIIQAALRVFGETGYLGATTRRIAQEAGVNEVTLFRLFGSKEELIQEAVKSGTMTAPFRILPADPVDPEQELGEWVLDHMKQLYEARSVIRTCMVEWDKHHEFAACAGERPRNAAGDLARYLVRLQKRGLAEPDFDAAFAATLLMGAMFSDVLGRDVMPEMYGFSLEDAAAEYVGLFLRAIGCRGTQVKLHGASTRKGGAPRTVGGAKAKMGRLTRAAVDSAKDRTSIPKATKRNGDTHEA